MNQEYAKVKHLVETDFIKDFAQFVASFQKKTLYKHIHVGPETFNERLANPSLFTIGELHLMADLVNVEREKIVVLASKAVPPAPKKKGKK